MLEKHARKGRLVYVAGKLQSRRWRKEGEDTDRYSTEIMLVPGGRVQFLDKPNGNGAPVAAEPVMAPANGETARTAPTTAADGIGDEDPVLAAFLSSLPLEPAPRASALFSLPAGRSPPPLASGRGTAVLALRASPPAARRREAGGGRGRTARPAIPGGSRHERHRYRRRPRPARRTGLPALPSPRPQAGPILDLRRRTRRQGPIPVRPPRAARRPRQVDRRRHRRARRPARPHPVSASARRPSSPPSTKPAPSSPCRRSPAGGGRRIRPQSRPPAASGAPAAPSTAPTPRTISGPRAIHCCRFPALRFHPALDYRDRRGFRRLPALVAAVASDDGAIDGIHRTWLDPAAPAKADVVHPRKALGHVHGRAVRFGSPGAFVPPPGLARLVVARDNDAEGQRAADRLRRRCRDLDVPTAVIVPERGDFNDDLVAFGAPALAARIAPLFHASARGPAR